MTKKQITILAIAAHLVVASIAIYADVVQPPRARTWLPILGGYGATVLIVATALFAGHVRIPSRPARAGMSLLLSLVFSGFLWIATFSVYLVALLLYRRLVQFPAA